MNKQGFGKLVSLAQAKQIISQLIPKLSTEIISINESLGRVLAQDIYAKIDVPHFAKSAMDGFACIAENTFGASNTRAMILTNIDFVSAGMISQKEIRKNECIEITTGSPLPKGADAVVMMEYTQKENNNVEIFKSVTPEENIIKIGSDIKKGTILFKDGTILNPRYLGVLASQGITEIVVYVRPKITYFSSGNEIIELLPENNTESITGELMENRTLDVGKIYDINSITVVQTLKQIGCDVNYLGIAKDDKQDIINKIRQGLAASSDIIILSGGSSLGGEDFMHAAVSELGKILIHGIAAKPGKPVLVGVIPEILDDKDNSNKKKTVVLGLPGYPTSTLSNVYILVIPIIEKILNCSFETRKVKARLSRKVASTIGRYEFLPVSLKEERDLMGKIEYVATPIMRGSSSITSLSLADGFIGIDENTEVLNKDDLVDVILML